MVWRSQQAPAISFYGPIDSWGDLWFYVSRQGYSEVDVSPAAGWSDRAAFLGWLGADIVRQTTLPGCALAALGLGVLARGGGLVATALAGSGVAALLGNSVVLIALLGFDFDPFWLAVFRPYPLVCYGVAALWAGGRPAGAGFFRHLRSDRASDRPLGASDGFLGRQLAAGGSRRLNRSSPSRLKGPDPRPDFFHGLLRPGLDEP